MSDKPPDAPRPPIESMGTNHALALGRIYIDRNPINVLQQLRSSIGYSPSLGYVICLGKDQNGYLYKILTECIAYHTGGDTIMKKE